MVSITDIKILVSKDSINSANNGDNMVIIFSDHPITKAMNGMNLSTTVGATQPVRADLEENTSQLDITPLL
jgi:hypothetical protein